ncbi:PIG-L family deacetylase [Roseicyclus persicicus]|uniref:PIG-L family deacetylase n=1 Tax=Roseicyclus persicicus TaxID=2650661 RepID=A0A7X6GX01_9RHOB|nr:PIG-L family deacetylase [Roseibacterium persicicum]NKX43103.1 PIG-L family deacetylase [Roseibacterium persicicum]
MPTPDQTRLLSEAQDPLIARVWRAMAGLRTTVTFMNTGAHPDDETSEMLAALWLRDGVNLSYACSTRGEGGQNDIGTEGGADLGTLRTAEMERAAEVLDMRLYWHGQSADDSITDFRFSKSGVETMRIWGRDRLMARFVEIIRTDRPDIICPTFLDIPGQHGHHRAMTEAAHAVIAAAADPAFPGCDLAPWQVSKLYLPGFSGAGGAYDDEVPPPPATVVVPGRGADPVLGMPYARVGQWSRQFHRTQGMGRWVPADAARDWPLHLAWSCVGADTGAVTDNLPRTLADLGLAEAQAAIDAALAAFPDMGAMCRLAARALTLLEGAGVAPGQAHRVDRKRAQLARLIRLTSGATARARPARGTVAPGEAVAVAVEVEAAPGADISAALIAAPGLDVTPGGYAAAPDAPPADPYPDSYDPLAPRAPALAVEVVVEGVASRTVVPLDTPLLVLPAARARLSEGRAFVNLATSARTVRLEVAGRSAGAAAFDLPAGWGQDWQGNAVTLTLPDGAGEALVTLPLALDGRPARSVRHIAHDHVAPRLNHAPAALTLRTAHVALPAGRIGYVGAGNDRVAHWLRAAGMDVTELDDAALAHPEGFAGLDAVLVGVFAYRFRPALKPAVPRLNAWVKAGGTLVTLYHRPWDDWDPAATPPARIEIGQPSLRWRITDAAAEVGLLEPDHPVLAGPNRITPADWTGWQKERGLYFAKSWGPEYRAILRMADPDEQPLDGGLLVGEIGRGCHAHVALNLHHQLACLVPGAYRLMANLLALRGRG